MRLSSFLKSNSASGGGDEGGGDMDFDMGDDSGPDDSMGDADMMPESIINKMSVEQYKDYLNTYFDEQIEKLEEQRDVIKESLENGALDQQQAWDKMTSQLKAFVAEWNSTVAKMSMVGGGGSLLGFASGNNSVNPRKEMNAYAKGKGSVGDSEIALVGDNPKYREIVIGSKLNNDMGKIMALKRGSGVVNASATNTLASLFNSISGSRVNYSERSINNNGQNIVIENITLPQIKNGNDFVNYLKNNFVSDMTQKSYSR